MAEFKNNYPTIMIHGLSSWGAGDELDKIFHYWGFSMTRNLIAYLRRKGYEVYNPSTGPFNSAWDRSCEMYAQIMGGTVDYGKVHSEKYGHARYGRTYPKPLFNGFGPDKKINLFGHSFGGATIRLFATLMAYGSEEEKAVTPENELSDLFKGGKEDWIFSITAVASVHEGTTLLYSAKDVMSKLEDVTYMLANISGNNILGKFYESHMEQWGLIDCEVNGKIKSRPFDRTKQQKIKDSHDNVWYDLTMQGAKEVNEKIKCLPNVYYFSWPCCKTSQKFFQRRPQQTPRFTMCPLFYPMSYSIGNYPKNTVDDYPIDEHWLANDGLVPTISETAPFNEPHMDLHDANKIEKGKWYVYDVFPTDHLGICGGFLLPTSASKIQKIYGEHCRTICQLKK